MSWYGFRKVSDTLIDIQYLVSKSVYTTKPSAVLGTDVTIQDGTNPHQAADSGN